MEGVGDEDTPIDLYHHMVTEGGATAAAAVSSTSASSSQAFLMDTWVHQLYEQVCMMSGGGTVEGGPGVGHIKQEDGGYGGPPTTTHHHTRPRQISSCSSPSTTAIASEVSALPTLVTQFLPVLFLLFLVETRGH
nr:uncharacterized protein LOC123748193 [Procambarus clarkii]